MHPAMAQLGAEPDCLAEARPFQVKSPRPYFNTNDARTVATTSFSIVDVSYAP